MVKLPPPLALAFGVAAMAFAGSIFAQAGASTTDTNKQTAQGATPAQRDAQTQAAVTQTIEIMKAKNVDQAAAKDRSDQSIEAAKGEHQVALSKCESQTGEPQKSCKERADADFSAAKSKANHALEADQSAQP
jgi:hypothetical protein